MKKLQNYIDGELVAPRAGGYLDDVDPSTGEVYAQIPDSDAEDVDRAVAAADRAFPGWAATPAAEGAADEGDRGACDTQKSQYPQRNTNDCPLRSPEGFPCNLQFHRPAPPNQLKRPVVGRKRLLDQSR